MKKDCSTCKYISLSADEGMCRGCRRWSNWTNQNRIDLNEYQELAERTAGRKDQRERFCNFGLGIAGEAGEVTDYLKKVLFHGHELDKDKLCKELGDVMWYVATIATTAGLTLEEVAIENIDKLRKRYPEGFEEVRSINREEER